MALTDFMELCHELDDFLNELVGGEENRAEYIPYNQLDDIHNVIVAYDDDIPVGSVSFKKYDDECAEVKRVFVKEEYRNKGIANELMELLENTAREQGYRYLILESGEPLVAAMALYRKIGYKVILNYGQYKNMPDSICMKKETMNCQRAFGVVRFNEMKNTVEKSPAKHCVRRSRSLDQTGWCTGRDIHRFLRRRNTA